MSFLKDEFLDDGSSLFTSENFQVSTLTRRNIYDELISMEKTGGRRISGRLDLIAFLKRLWPLDEMPSTDERFQTAGADIHQHVVNFHDWDYYYLFNYLGLTKGTDEQFLAFLEELTRPEVRLPDEQKEIVSLLNKYLERDGFQLQEIEHTSGYPIYRAVRIGDARVERHINNLIFAADGPKPEIVLDDSISNKIRVIKNEEYCLIYDSPIPPTGLRWADLVAWWSNRVEHVSSTIETERNLYNRLYKSLADSKEEQLFFRTYYERMRPELEDKLPALIPQVYLHYDPYTIRQLAGAQRLPRQRIDFLFLFSSHERTVIEIDGKQHYSDDDKPSPEKYAQMVAADRKLRLNGYEVYRFGTYELRASKGKALVEEFIRELFKKHRVLSRYAA